MKLLKYLLKKICTKNHLNNHLNNYRIINYEQIKSKKWNVKNVKI